MKEHGYKILKTKNKDGLAIHGRAAKYLDNSVI